MQAKVQEVRLEKRPPEPRPVAAVVADVLGNLEDILSSEIRLAKAQTRAELRTIQSAATLIVLGVLAGLLSGFFLLFSAVAALSLVIAFWLAALIVGLGTAVLCAAILHLGGKRLKSRTASAAARLTEPLMEQTSWTGRPKA
jgi:hypothetical protein